LMENGQPQDFDRSAASNYLKQAAAGEYLKTDTVLITVDIGVGSGKSVAWGCDLTYKYVEINAEYTT
ncbi:MAG: bifunctional ornithine acetyltransferase/N-acetylglutamate synthase, partial [Waterburya sp.]